MKRTLKYVAITLLVLVIVVLATTSFIANKYEKEITSTVIAELNKQIETEVDVEDISFSVLRNFPMVSLEFKNVFIHSTKAFLESHPNQDTLVWAKKISLDFNLIDVFDGNYVLKQMQLKNAVVKMQVDKEGEDNFHFIKKTQTSTNTRFSINLKKVILNKVDYCFNNTHLSSDFRLYAKQFILAGNLSDDEFGLSTSGSLLLQKIMLDNVNYLMYPNTSMNVDLQVNNSKVEVTKGHLKIGNEYLDLKGAYWFDKQSYIDIEAVSEQMSIQNIIRNLPKKFRSNFKDFETKGQIAFNLLVKGEVSKNKLPNIEITAKVDKASVVNIHNNIPLKDLSFKAHYLSSSSLLEVNNFKGQLYESSAKGDFTIRDFLHPNISANIDIETDLKELKMFFELDSLSDFQGQVKANLRLTGQLKSNNEITKNDIRTFKTSGDIHVSNAKVLFVDSRKRDFRHLSANLQLDNNNIIIDSLSFLLDKSNVFIRGKAYNTLAFVLLDEERLNVNGEVFCDSLNMLDILSPNKTKDQVNNDFQYPKNIAARLEIKIKRFVYDKFIAEHVYAQFYMDESMTQISDFRMNTSDGIASGQIEIRPLSNGDYKLEVASNLSNIDVDKIMYQLDNFGQTSIDYKNLEGKLSAVSQIKSTLKSDFSFVKKDLEVVTSFDVINGKLKNYKPLYKLSKFIKLSELENIQFKKFQNILRIKNSILYLPKMEVKSNAINLKISGEHNFENHYVYHLNVLLSEILGKKARKNKKENQEFDFVQEDSERKTSIFLLIEGDGDKMKIKYDTKGVKEKIKENIQDEKINMKTILNEEFGLFKKDSAVIENKKKTKPKSTKQNFKVEWDDE